MITSVGRARSHSVTTWTPYTRRSRVDRRIPSICKIPAFHYHDCPVHTINRYVLREIFVPFALGLAVFTLILLIARILKLVEMVVNRGVPLLEVLKLFSYILPAFLEVTVPMALLLGVLVAFGRLSSDSEIIALKTSGISLYQLLRPVASFAIVIYFVALGLSLYARPWGNSLLHSGLYEIAKTRASAGIKEKVFNDDFSGLVIYVDHIEPPGNTLRGILISDTRDSSQRNTVFAQVGVLVPNERLHVLTLRLLRRQHPRLLSERPELPPHRLQHLRHHPRPEHRVGQPAPARKRSERNDVGGVAAGHRRETSCWPAGLQRSRRAASKVLHSVCLPCLRRHRHPAGNSADPFGALAGLHAQLGLDLPLLSPADVGRESGRSAACFRPASPCGCRTSC